jgi:CRISPR system Cascade subunit CasA
LVRAHEIREIAHGSPLVTISLHRMLLAVLYRALAGPASTEEWAELWQVGRWKADAIQTYLKSQRSRFDLFDPVHPFYQVPQIPDASGLLPISVLAHELASGNNATLFDHNVNTNPASMLPAEAARYLVAMQAYAIGGGVASPFNFTGGPLTPGLSMLVQGDNLFETLALNLIPYRRDVPVRWTGDDRPAWEQESRRQPDKAGTPPLGYLDLLTWQSRRFHLIPEGDPPVIRWCRRQQYLRLAEDIRDPFKHYRQSKEKGWLPLPLRSERAVWRDSAVLFQHTVERRSHQHTVYPPRQFEMLAEVRTDQEADLAPAYRLAAFGVATEPGKAGSLLLWRQERLPLPLAYLQDADLVLELGIALEAAEKAGEVLRASVRVLAQNLLPPGSDVSALVRSLGTEQRYWWRLEEPSARLIAQLPDDATIDADGSPHVEGRVRTTWVNEVQSAAREALGEATRDVSGTGAGLRAVAHADRFFHVMLHRELAPYRGEKVTHVPTG